MNPARWMWWAFAGAAAYVALAPLLPSSAWPLHLLLFAVLPGWWLATRLWPHWPFETRLGAAFALAPFAIGAPAAACLAWGHSVALARTAPLLLWAAIALVTGLLPQRAAAASRANAHDHDIDAHAHRALALGAALAWAGVCGVLLRSHLALVTRSDGWFHGAVLAQILQRGAPPEDPYFAGLRLLYFWGWHTWAAQWLAVTSSAFEHLYRPLVAANVTAAAGVLLGVAALARALGARPRVALLASALTVCSYAPFAWVLLVGRAFTGEVRGWADLSQQLHAGVDPVLSTLAGPQVHLSMAFFGDKFLVLTPFATGLALLPFALLALLELLRAPGLRALLALACVLAAALFTHTVIGEALCGLTGLALLVVCLHAARGDATARRALPLLLAALVLAIALLLPYLLEISLGKRNALSLAYTPKAFLSWLWGSVLLLPAAAFALRAPRARANEVALLLVFAFALSALAVFLKLPENNQSKFLNLLWLLLAAPAALGWDTLADRGRLWRALVAGGLVIATAPTVALALAGFALEEGQSASSWRPASAATAAAMVWARQHTPPDAIFCDLGGGKEVLTMAGRSTYWAGVSGERDWGYAPAAMADRRALVLALCRGREPVGRAADLLAETRRPLYIVARAALPDSLRDHGALATRPERFALRWANTDIAIYELQRGLAATGAAR